MDEHDAPQSRELTALREMLASEGWRLFVEMTDATWGAEAVLARLEAKVGSTPLGHQDAADDATQHILSASKHIRALLKWPETRIQQLQHEKEPLTMREKAARLLAAKSPKPGAEMRRIAR